MINQHAILQAFDGKLIHFPNGMKVRRIETSQIKSFIDFAGQNYELTKSSPFRDPIYYWHELDLGLAVMIFEVGLVFQSVEEAQRFIPKLRTQGFSRDEMFFFLALNREEVDDLLTQPSWHKIRVEGFNVFVNKQNGQFMSRMGGGPANWFQKEAHFQAYMDFMNEMEATL